MANPANHLYEMTEFSFLKEMVLDMLSVNFNNA